MSDGKVVEILSAVSRCHFQTLEMFIVFFQTCHSSDEIFLWNSTTTLWVVKMTTRIFPFHIWACVHSHLVVMVALRVTNLIETSSLTQAGGVTFFLLSTLTVCHRVSLLVKMIEITGCNKSTTSSTLITTTRFGRKSRDLERFFFFLKKEIV